MSNINQGVPYPLNDLAAKDKPYFYKTVIGEKDLELYTKYNFADGDVDFAVVLLASSAKLEKYDIDSIQCQVAKDAGNRLGVPTYYVVYDLPDIRLDDNRLPILENTHLYSFQIIELDSNIVTAKKS